jgi:L-threonylcarbamoyladenylate synthase
MITTDIPLIRDLLTRGEVVGIPTETVYGLAANIYDDQAIARIFQTKKRPQTNPLIVHVPSYHHAKELVKFFPEKAALLAKHFWPGPLTLILPKKPQVGDVVTGGQPTVAIRIPNHPLTLQLLEQLEFPLAAPSANPYNRISPTSAQQVDFYFPELHTLDGGECVAGLESTIVAFEEDEVVLLRHGAIAVADIEKQVGRILNRTSSSESPNSPGRSKKHYSPLCDLIVTYEPLFMLSAVQEKKVGIVWFYEVKIESEKVMVNRVLSPIGDLREAARNLFKTLHELEQMGLDLIIVERLPDQGLGQTINDRLERAAVK